MAVALTSAEGLLSLFRDNDPQTKAFALQKLSEVAPYFWHEISNYLKDIHSLAFDYSYPQHELAAFLAAQIHFHLENYSEALQLALEANHYFDIFAKTDFVQTLVSRCIDEYIGLRVKNYQARTPEDKVQIPEKMEFVVERMFEKCFQEGEFKQAIGIALESRRIDKMEESIRNSPNLKDMIEYTYNTVKDIVIPRDFRNEVVRSLVNLQMSATELDYAAITEYDFFLNDSETVSQMLETLIEKDSLLAKQLAFDLVENQNQQFLNKVSEKLPTGEEKDVKMLHHILSGRASIDITLEFLSNKNNYDKMIMEKVKSAADNKNSVTHEAALYANAFMNAGTANDSFLRDHINWVGKATNWAKFSAAASLGVIHRGNVTKYMEILRPYLPNEQGSSTGNQYSEGGALYAMGLIHANYMHQDALSYIVNSLLANNQSEVIQHGACLGLGLTAMATADSNVFEHLKNVLYTDSANAAEAASYGMGLVMLGSASEVAISEMLSYAHETQHEKIIRALGIGLALIMYRREEEADTLITQLTTDKDPILRYGGAYCMATAYVGTGNTKVIKKLLHTAVSDVDYDVRKAAVTAIGLVLYRMPEKVPQVVGLLAESYNPYVRQGAAFAIGIASAGKPSLEALNLLESLTSDNTNFVRQAAYIATAMVLCQATKAFSNRVSQFKEKLEKIMTEKHQDILTKFGAITANGILEAGGRNTSLQFDSKTGNNKATATVGVVLGLQFWYWFPMLHMFSLAFSPTCIIGLNDDLLIPNSFQFTSRAKPSLFAYPAKLEAPSAEKEKKLSSAVLSTTYKVKARAAAKKGEKAMDIEEDKTQEQEKKEEEPKGPEPSSEVLSNPSRVLPAQERVIEFLPDNRYCPVVKRKSGIIMLRDSSPGQGEDFLNKAQDPSLQETQMDIPEEFEYDPEVQQKGFS